MSELYVQKQGPPVRAEQFFPERKPWPEGVFASRPGHPRDEWYRFQPVDGGRLICIDPFEWVIYVDPPRVLPDENGAPKGYERVGETDRERAELAQWAELEANNLKLAVEEWGGTLSRSADAARRDAERLRRIAELLRAPQPEPRLAPTGDPEDARKLLHAYAAAMAAYHSSEGGTEQTNRLEELEATLVSRLCLRSAGAPLPEPEPVGWVLELAPRRDGESWVINQVCWRPDDPNDPESRWAWWNEYAASEPQTYRVRRLLAVVASTEPPTERREAHDADMCPYEARMVNLDAQLDQYLDAMRALREKVEARRAERHGLCPPAHVLDWVLSEIDTLSPSPAAEPRKPDHEQ